MSASADPRITTKKGYESDILVFLDGVEVGVIKKTYTIENYEWCAWRKDEKGRYLPEGHFRFQEHAELAVCNAHERNNESQPWEK